ncbi:SDR family oxidoreductase [Lactococcus lactis]|uniref:SDR family oxidoreductase n=1 Tax=Lactococcus lactis TaxID=1358 RepID=UPI0024182C7D|nr:SDR family oxidoreductase [Lactococcus lactis]MDG4967165.1 SDR family oxidoreductase [Lactococcus lactis]
MYNLKNKVVVITGASSGIGKATTEKLAKAGAKLIISARRASLLEKISSELSEYEVSYKVADVTKLDDMKELIKFADSKYGRIDAMFHNAGIMPMGPLSDNSNESNEKWLSAVNVNIMGVINGLSAGLPYMVKQNHGHMIAMGSVAGHLVYPNSAVYCGTKYAIGAIMEGVRQENIENNIRSTMISPGIVNTNLVDSVKNSDIEAWVKGETSDPYKSLSSEDVADAVIYALSTPDNVAISEVLMRSSKHIL